jgi:uncharacterized DUF497 family protein
MTIKPPVTSGAAAFEWDDRKYASNIEKHGIDFEDATEAFGDPNSFEYRFQSSESEPRCVIVGLMRKRLISVVYTIRESRIRIISARVARREERKLWNANTS